MPSSSSGHFSSPNLSTRPPGTSHSKPHHRQPARQLGRPPKRARSADRRQESRHVHRPSSKVRDGKFVRRGSAKKSRHKRPDGEDFARPRSDANRKAEDRTKEKVRGSSDTAAVASTSAVDLPEPDFDFVENGEQEQHSESESVSSIHSSDFGSDVDEVVEVEEVVNDERRSAAAAPRKKVSSDAAEIKVVAEVKTKKQHKWSESSDSDGGISKKSARRPVVSDTKSSQRLPEQNRRDSRVSASESQNQGQSALRKRGHIASPVSQSNREEIFYKRESRRLTSPESARPSVSRPSERPSLQRQSDQFQRSSGPGIRPSSSDARKMENYRSRGADTHKFASKVASLEHHVSKSIAKLPKTALPTHRSLERNELAATNLPSRSRDKSPEDCFERDIRRLFRSDERNRSINQAESRANAWLGSQRSSETKQYSPEPRVHQQQRSGDLYRVGKYEPRDSRDYSRRDPDPVHQSKTKTNPLTKSTYDSARRNKSPPSSRSFDQFNSTGKSKSEVSRHGGDRREQHHKRSAEHQGIHARQDQHRNDRKDDRDRKTGEKSAAHYSPKNYRSRSRTPPSPRTQRRSNDNLPGPSALAPTAVLAQNVAPLITSDISARALDIALANVDPAAADRIRSTFYASQSGSELRSTALPYPSVAFSAPFSPVSYHILPPEQPPALLSVDVMRPSQPSSGGFTMDRARDVMGGPVQARNRDVRPNSRQDIVSSRTSRQRPVKRTWTDRKGGRASPHQATRDNRASSPRDYHMSFGGRPGAARKYATESVVSRTTSSQVRNRASVKLLQGAKRYKRREHQPVQQKVVGHQQRSGPPFDNGSSRRQEATRRQEAGSQLNLKYKGSNRQPQSTEAPNPNMMPLVGNRLTKSNRPVAVTASAPSPKKSPPSVTPRSQSKPNRQYRKRQIEIIVPKTPRFQSNNSPSVKHSTPPQNDKGLSSPPTSVDRQVKPSTPGSSVKKSSLINDPMAACRNKPKSDVINTAKTTVEISPQSRVIKLRRAGNSLDLTVVQSNQR